MHHLVIRWNLTDVPDEHDTSVLGTNIDNQKTSMEVFMPVMLVYCMAYYSTLKMEVIFSAQYYFAFKGLHCVISHDRTLDIGPLISGAIRLPPPPLQLVERWGEPWWTRMCVYIATCLSNYRWAFDSLSSYNSYLQLTLALSLFHTLCNSLQHVFRLISKLFLHQSCGNGSQRRTSLFL
jgi:hypothetical protein